MCSQAENQNVDSVEEKENIATEQQAETVVENNDEATKVEDAETLLKINKLTEDLAAAKDEVLRAQAEVANMRRRCEQEVDKARKFALDRFEKENAAAYFDGNGSYLEIPDNDVFSIVEKGALTISVWVSPEVLTFEKAESGGYVHWMGKGIPGQHEWVFRMYNKDLTAEQENRPNRMSAYAFNLEGGLGSGSYVQESLEVNEWIHFVARYDVKENSITLFKNGIEKDRDDFEHDDDLDRVEALEYLQRYLNRNDAKYKITYNLMGGDIGNQINVESYTKGNEVKIKNPFKKGNVVDTLINVGVGGAGNVAADYLINNDINSASSKNQAAKQLGIPIISEAKFFEII